MESIGSPPTTADVPVDYFADLLDEVAKDPSLRSNAGKDLEPKDLTQTAAALRQGKAVSLPLPKIRLMGVALTPWSKNNIRFYKGPERRDFSADYYRVFHPDPRSTAPAVPGLTTSKTLGG